MKQAIEIPRNGRTPSKVVIGDVINSLDNFLPQGSKVIIITDPNVHHHYRDIINRYEYLLIGKGEEIKTLETVARLYSELLAMGADRSSYIVGFGGGIVTDITGFVASTYLRGVSFGFIASTLLAQVDASVGGKNGVNFEGYKNMIGTFNQPDFVLCDPSLLSTLPEREFRAGLAEIIKSGIIADVELFNLFEIHKYEDFLEDPKLLTESITRAVKVKASIVEKDEKESGERRKLNLGHTFGHAIEKSTRKFLHGEAVAIGMVMAAGLAVKYGTMSEAEAKRIRSVIERMGLPSESGIPPRELLSALKKDKKKESSSIAFVLPRRIGECTITPISFEDIDRMELQEL